MPFARKEDELKYRREWMAKRRAAFFKDKVCVQCGSDKQLELDHIDPTTKITHCVWSWTEIKRKAELAKCQVLCKSCHKKKSSEYRKVPITHGTVRSYWQGCRCNLCRKSSALYKQSRRQLNRG